MMSQLNLEDIYTELNDLLKDVCSFLTTEAQNGTLSAKAKNEAEKLVSRSRKQVEIVTQLSVLQESTNPNYPYLEMLPGGVAEEYVLAEPPDYDELQHYEESYPPADIEPISSPPSITTEKEECLYADSPQDMIKEKSVKYGPLWRKERYLFIEQKRQYMAFLVEYWLLIYALNKKDQKPIQTINLSNYSASSLKQRKDPTFEICAENEKTYEFIARTIKDVDQWVKAINCKKHVYVNGRNLPQIPLVTISQQFDDSDRNSNQNNSDNQNVMPYGSDEDIYASVEDFGKLDLPKPLPTPVTEEFPKLPPRASKEVPSSPKISKSDNTYNNLQKNETEANDDTCREYDDVQCLDTQIQNNNEEEQLEIYDELKIIETVNMNVRAPSFSNINTTLNNYDSVDTGEVLEDYDTLKPSKIPIKVNSPKYNVQEDEDMVDYDELKPICRPNNLKHASSKTQLQKDEELENYDELKPIACKFNQPTKTTSENSSEEVLENYDVLKPVSQNKPIYSPNPEDEELEDYEMHPIPESNQNKSNINVEVTPPEDEELVIYDDIKTILDTKPSQPKDPPAKQEILEALSKEPKSSKQTENNSEAKSVKPPKPIKKFWEKRVFESSKKETDTSEEDEPKRSVASLKSKFNVQASTSQEKNKPLITSPKPKSQTLLNKFPSFSKNKNSKDEESNSNKVQNIRQQLENTLLFKNYQ